MYLTNFQELREIEILLLIATEIQLLKIQIQRYWMLKIEREKATSGGATYLWHGLGLVNEIASIYSMDPWLIPWFLIDWLLDDLPNPPQPTCNSNSQHPIAIKTTATRNTHQNSTPNSNFSNPTPTPENTIRKHQILRKMRILKLTWNLEGF